VVKATAIILKGYPRLSETFIAQEIRDLEKHGLPVVIFSLRHPTDKKHHLIHDEIEAPVTYLPEYLHRDISRVWGAWKIVRNWSTFRKFYKACVKDLSHSLTPNSLRRFGQAMVLAAELPNEIGHLHAHFLHTPASVTRYAAILKGLPWSCSAHAVDIWTTPKVELKDKLNECEWVVTCTESNRLYLASLTEQKNKIFLAYHGIDLERFAPHKKLYNNRNGLDVNNPVHILSVGRAVEKKGYVDLLSALAIIPKSLNWKMLHIGGGPLVAKLKRIAISLGISDRIMWLGPQLQNEVIQQYKDADFFVLSSLVAPNGDRDGLPNVLMEAQSQGLACLSTVVSAIPELIKNEVNGVLVEPNDIDMLAKKLTMFIQDPEQRAILGQAGQDQLKKCFNFDKCMEQIYPLFDLKLNLVGPKNS
jgi:glycosyltransferase involved in cell wall biosynthesis